MQLTKPFQHFISKAKVYYPFFLASDYTPLQYSPYYGQKAAQLKIDKPNLHQINYTTLPHFLAMQIEEDKSLFIKEKEFIFVGRSNSGKSSLINSIFKEPLNRLKKKIARTAKGPGTTKFLHFHHIHNEQTLLVDAPGYGFARMNKKRRQLWFGLTEEYMKISSRVSQIFLCINIEHGLKPNDVLFLQRAERYNIDVQVILTKADKLKPQKYFAQLQAIVEGIKRMKLKRINERIIAVSTKSKFGVQVMRMRIIEAIENSKQRNIDNNQDLLLTYVKEMRVQRTRIEQRQPRQSKQFLLRKLIYQSRLTKYLK